MNKLKLNKILNKKMSQKYEKDLILLKA